MPSETFSKLSDGISSIKTIKNRFNTKGRSTRPSDFIRAGLQFSFSLSKYTVA
ncbi:TPA: hypothetical protein ACFRGQ_000333 [Neisseria lactamica]|uniref:hypothetical protein n=1 Tax=Neisseria lactamica TaxID=486 RepID=UPI001864CB06|nr:hypothetical protein [Neisseria lactamica]